IRARPVGRLERAAKWARRNPAVAGLTAALALVLVVGVVTGLWLRSRVIEQSQKDYAAALVQRLLHADTAQAPGIMLETEGYRTCADPVLREKYKNAAPSSRSHVLLSLALLPVDTRQTGYLYERLLDAAP